MFWNYSKKLTPSLGSRHSDGCTSSSILEVIIAVVAVAMAVAVAVAGTQHQHQ